MSYCKIDGNFLNIKSDGKTYRMIYPEPPHGTEADDVYANNYISNLAYMTITSTGSNNISVSFSPCIDENLLKRVEKGKTKVRIQILNHHTSAHSEHNIEYGHRAVRLEPEHYWTNSEDYEDGASHWTRLHATELNYEGSCWKDLTAEQLRQGSAVLSNGAYYRHNTVHLGAVDKDYLMPKEHLAVQMYCPALYRSHKDQFYYEREDEIYYISDNYIEYDDN